MFSTVGMSRMTLAAPVDAMADIMRACSDLGCVHIEDYTQFEKGIGIGRAIQSEDADKVSAMLVKFVPSEAPFPCSTRKLFQHLRQVHRKKFEAELDKALGTSKPFVKQNKHLMLEEQARIFEKLHHSTFHSIFLAATPASKSMLPKLLTHPRRQRSLRTSRTM